MSFRGHWVGGYTIGLGNWSELLTPCWEDPVGDHPWRVRGGNSTQS